MAWPRELLLPLALICAGCGGERRDHPTPTPEPDRGNAAPGNPHAPTLVPKLPWLKELAAAVPPDLEPTRARQVQDLLEAAFLPGAADSRTAARAAAGLMDEPDAVLIFLLGLQHEDPAVRVQSVFHLAQLGRREVLPVLLKQVKYETDLTVTIWLRAAAMRLHNDTYANDLALWMDNDDTADEAGRAAIDALNARGEPLAEAPTFVDLQGILRRLHTHWLTSGTVQKPTDTEQVPVEPDPQLRGRIARLLIDLDGFQLRPVDEARYVVGRLGADALPLLAVTLQATESYLRTHSVEIVRTLGPAARPLVPVLLPLLHDPLTATYTMLALGEIGDPAATAPLLERLHHENQELAMAAALALGPQRDPVAIPDLERLLADDKVSRDLRVGVAFALAVLQDGGPGRTYLEERLASGDYHEARVKELLDRATTLTR